MTWTTLAPLSTHFWTTLSIHHRIWKQKVLLLKYWWMRQILTKVSEGQWRSIAHITPLNIKLPKGPICSPLFPLSASPCSRQPISTSLSTFLSTILQLPWALGSPSPSSKKPLSPHVRAAQENKDPVTPGSAGENLGPQPWTDPCTVFLACSREELLSFCPSIYLCHCFWWPCSISLYVSIIVHIT